jgi:release factor glutamine methyltransferase
MGRIFFCDKRALIPRPETEELVAAAAALSERWYKNGATIIDVGTGTGCIAITLALTLPHAHVTATDNSAEALALACENAAAHGQDARVTFRQADLLDGFEPASADIIVSNPPYVADGEAASLASEVREHEPRTALFAGADGLDAIRRLVPQAFRVLRSDGWLFLEIGENQGVAVKQILELAGFKNVTVRKDLSDHNRIVCAQRA